MAQGSSSKVAVDAETGSAAIVAQQRIFQLKKERDGKIKDVVSKAIAELDDIKRQVTHGREEHERQQRQRNARILLDIAKMKQRLNAIEEEMITVVLDIQKIMVALEDAMIQTYDAKEHEVKHVMEYDHV